MNQTEASSHSHLLTEAERQKLLLEWNATEMELPKATSIHELIEQKATESPDAIALICRDGELTCSKLNARANRLASHLRKLGAGPETLVGICVERTQEMVIGLLGILKSGGAYVPLDPTYPKERLAFMLEDAKPLVLLTQSTLLHLLPNTGSHIVCLDNFDWAANLTSTDYAPRATHHASALAYVLYTSGSTGKPKGVMIEHGNVLNFFAGMDARVPHGPGATWLAVTSTSFDISVLELFWTLSRGFKVVLYPGDEPGLVADEFSIPALIRRHGVTHLQCTPSGAGMMLLDEQTRESLGKLQIVLIGGEAFPVKLARELRQIFKGTILNMYGPTETTVWSTTWQLPRDVAPARIPVGRPIANTQIYIVDSNLQPVPVGVEGELLIGGAGVARGYLRRDQLTAERFIPNPFAANGSARRSASRPGSQQPESTVVQVSSRLRAEPNALRAGTARAPTIASGCGATCLYRTGDLARYLPDGNIELLGRIDQQVKIRGHRVELGEIEARLNEHPGVRESVILFRELTNGERTLVAYIIPRPEQKPTPEQLRLHAQQKLPDFMVPARVMFMSAFPQTPNKKIDRNAFPPPESDAREAKNGAEQSATPIEDVLAALWKELLDLKSVGRDDNFFESGGHSMLAMQLVARVRKHFKVDFRLKNVFERQTLAGMAEVVEAMSWADFVKTPRAGEREVVDV
jgi:amino acid adenylation domain-containing protein